VDLDAAPEGLSFRVEVSSLRPLDKQLVILAEGKLYVTSEEAHRTANGTWELDFRRVGSAIPSPDGKRPAHITGVGFSPLERDGRYGIGPIEVFVDSSR
jgi:hypothetical protein